MSARPSSAPTPATSSACPIPASSRSATRSTPVPRCATRRCPLPASSTSVGARLLDQRSKQFDAGVRQLEEEGLMQVVFPVHGRREPILGVVGPLQLDIVEARLRQEMGVECKIDPISHVAMRWVTADARTLSDLENRSSGVLRAVDRDERPVLLFESPWHLSYMQQQNPDLELKSLG
ncbi:MAG: hypothetical protein R2708_06715 [Vicinamibacterales bacterium]